MKAEEVYAILKKNIGSGSGSGGIGGSDSSWRGTLEEWEALSPAEKRKYEMIYFTDDYDDSGIGGSDSTWKGTREEWDALSSEEKGKYVVVYFTDDYNVGDSTGLIDDTNVSNKTTYSSEKIAREIENLTVNISGISAIPTSTVSALFN